MNKKIKVASAIVASGLLTVAGLSTVHADDVVAGDVPAVVTGEVSSEPVPSEVPTTPPNSGAAGTTSGTETPVPSDTPQTEPSEVPTTPSDNGSTTPSEVPTTPSDNGSTTPSEVPTTPSDNGSTTPSEVPTTPSDGGKEDTSTSSDDSSKNTDGSGQNDGTAIIDNGNGTKVITTPRGDQVTVSTDKAQPTNNPNVTAQQAQRAGASQVGTTSTVTGQVVSNVTPSQPVTLATGQEIVGLQNGIAILSNGEQKPAEQLEGVSKNSDGTFTAKTSDGKKVTLPETGDELIVSAFLSLIGLGFFAGSVLLRKKKA